MRCGPHVPLLQGRWDIVVVGETLSLAQEVQTLANP